MLNEKLIFQAVRGTKPNPMETLAEELAAFQEKPAEHRRGIPWSWMAFRGPFEGFR
mgnify:CR=1 FL=1|jgi:hypothetical protein